MNRAEKRRNEKLAKKAAQRKKYVQPTTASPHTPTLNFQDIMDRAVQHHTAGQWDNARALYQQVLQVHPQHPIAMHLLGMIDFQHKNYEQALAHISKACAIAPDYADAHSNLGLVQQKLGQLDAAVSNFEKAIQINADFAEAYNNMGTALNELGKTEKGKACFLKSLSIKPDYAEAHFNLGNSYKNSGEFGQAINCYQAALAIKADYAHAYVNQGIALQAQSLSQQAFSSFQKALELKPNSSEIHSSLIFAQDFIPTIDQVEQQAERKRWNDKFILPLTKKIVPHSNKRAPDRRLRIGYVSADFRRHSAYLGFGPLIFDYDRANFDVTCYDNTILSDEISENLRKASMDWQFVRTMNDEELAQKIREDEIDILFDLSGHTLENRLTLFGLKPAPIQVTGIGHAPPGLSTIDYRLTTRKGTPPEEEEIYPENPIYLDTYFGFVPPSNPLPVAPSPFLENGFITFGYLGRLSKTSDELLGHWAKILQDVPHSRFLLKYPQLDGDFARQRVVDTFSSFGIGEERLVLLGQTDHRGHLEAHNQVDIVFDSFPHCGGITTLDSLWMGIPVLGLSNPNKFGSRIIESICDPLKLESWVARNTEEYHDIAVNWATRREELVKIRQVLRQQFKEVYFRFPQDVEKAYRLIWQRWCRDEPPSPLSPLS